MENIVYMVVKHSFKTRQDSQLKIIGIFENELDAKSHQDKTTETEIISLRNITLGQVYHLAFFQTKHEFILLHVSQQEKEVIKSVYNFLENITPTRSHLNHILFNNDWFSWRVKKY